MPHADTSRDWSRLGPYETAYDTRRGYDAAPPAPARRTAEPAVLLRPRDVRPAADAPSSRPMLLRREVRRSRRGIREATSE